jgi:type VI secretion system protein ImpH
MTNLTTHEQLIEITRTQALVNEPWNAGFFALMRILSAHFHSMPEIGTAQLPRDELFRLGQYPSLSFAPSEIQEIKIVDNKLWVRLFGLGMTGSNGPLPIHYTEILRERELGKRDATLSDFLDIFHHRFLTLFYRAWSQGQAVVGLDRPENEKFANYISRLSGDELNEISELPWPVHARLASAAHRIRSARNPDGLVSTLSKYFNVPVELKEFEANWIELQNDDLTCLGRLTTSSILGTGAVTGSMLFDRQSQFRLVFGPLTLVEYLRFTPNQTSASKDLLELIECVRSFLGFEFGWQLELLIKTETAPAARLAEGERLGWSTWVGWEFDNPHIKSQITGMLFEPEVYLQNLSNG